MKSIAQNKRYLQHEVTTKLYAVKLYWQVGDVQFVCRRYHSSKASLIRWNRLHDGTRESLEPKSHRPKTPHPNAHTEEEQSWIRNLHRRNLSISVCEMYGKLREEKTYSRHPGSLYRVFARLGYRRKAESTKKKSKHLGKYDVPIKWGSGKRMFCHTSKTKLVHPPDLLCCRNNIVHKTLRPRPL